MDRGWAGSQYGRLRRVDVLSRLHIEKGNIYLAIYVWRAAIYNTLDPPFPCGG